MHLGNVTFSYSVLIHYREVATQTSHAGYMSTDQTSETFFDSCERSTQTSCTIDGTRKAKFLQQVKTEAQLSACTGLNNFPGFNSLCAAVKYYFEV